jgi:hypothetical protein
LTYFWFDSWVGSVSLRSGTNLSFKLPISVSIELQMGNWERGESGCGSLDGGQILVYMHDQDLLNQLIESLRLVCILTTKDDWCWRHDLGGVFSVKSAYLVLEKIDRPQRILQREDIANLARDIPVWDSWASPKVILFSWQLLQDMIPTRQNLRKRRVLVGTTDISCVFCGAVEEPVDHLFVSCGHIPIWYRIFRWLGIEYVSPNRIMQVF